MKKLIILSLLFFFAQMSAAYSQSFDQQLLIDTPGNNYSFDVFNNGHTYLIWLNKKDSLYSVYYKYLTDAGEWVENKIDEDADSLSDIKISGYGNDVHAVWKRYKDGYSQIIYWYFHESVSTVDVLYDNLEMDSEADIGGSYLAWTNKGTLSIDNLLDSDNKIFTVDSTGCSSPDVQNNNSMFVKVLYSKDTLDFNLIKYAEIYNSVPPQISIEIKAEGTNSNPRFGNGPDEGFGITYQVYEGGVWKVFFSPYMGFAGTLTANANCNYYNPQVFAYDIPVTKPLIGTASGSTPFFVVYETDSIEGNSEIELRTFLFGETYEAINLSNQPGRDYNAKICMYTENDTQYVCVFWQNELDRRNTIYMAKTVFDPIYTIVCYEPVFTFKLEQNYPNPFNNSTTIQYGLSEQMLVNMKVYDILGNEIAELVNEVQSPGNYRVPVNAAGLASGTYFVKMTAGENQLVRKILLMK